MNTNSEPILKILSLVRTKDERDSILQKIELLEAALYRSQDEVLKVLRGEMPERIALVLRDVIQASKGNRDEIRNFLSDLKVKLSQMKILVLELAFEPSEESIEKIYRWVEENMGRELVLDVGLDKSILGGVRIIFNGRYLEKTLIFMISKTLEHECSNFFKKLNPGLSL